MAERMSDEVRQAFEYVAARLNLGDLDTMGYNSSTDAMMLCRILADNTRLQAKNTALEGAGLAFLGAIHNDLYRGFDDATRLLEDYLSPQSMASLHRLKKRTEQAMADFRAALTPDTTPTEEGRMSDRNYPNPAYSAIYDCFWNAGQVAAEAAGAPCQPSVLYHPTLTRDGNQWCALFGANIQDGVTGFGDSPAEAMAAFDVAWYTKLPTEGANSE